MSTDGTPASSAGSHVAAVERTSTASMPVCWRQATPPNGDLADGTSAPERGTSMREAILTGPARDQPLVVQ